FSLNVPSTGKPGTTRTSLTQLTAASCSLCLGLFQDPVSIHCGHNFCRGCIERCWESSRESFPCPRCRETAPERSLRPNRELAKIIGIAQRLSLRAGSRSAEGLCQRHGEALKLFCEEEQTPVCRVCRESREHRLHAAVPIEEAAEEHKVGGRLTNRPFNPLCWHVPPPSLPQPHTSFPLQERVDAERQKVRSRVKELQQLLEGQERLLLARLAKLDREIVRRQEESISSLAEQISFVGQQIQELEDKCQQPPWELLQVRPQSPQQTLKSRDHGLVEGPHRLPRPRLTLDPDTAHPRLALSQDGKSVWWEDTRRAVPDHPKRFDSSRCVLGREGFGSGRHYWEVRVGTGAAWAVGVAKESVRRKGRISVKPEVGIWAVGQCGSQCQALTSPLSPSPCLKPPRWLGSTWTMSPESGVHRLHLLGTFGSNSRVHLDHVPESVGAVFPNKSESRSNSGSIGIARTQSRNWKESLPQFPWWSSG
uniref:Uncharacterized protein n=1 Tax=Malurus cyaneus samueli TaxID=2593467 RepID=A0A8C5TFC9_9PASS